MDASTPYNGAITREQFLLRETRVVAQLKADDRLTNEQVVERVARLNRLLRDGLRTNPAVTINSPEDASPYILNLSVEGFRGAQLRDRLDERGFCVSVKSACSVENTPSRAVMAIARNRRRALSAFRVSLSHQTTEEELHAFLNTLDQLCKENPSCRAR